MLYVIDTHKGLERLQDKRSGLTSRARRPLLLIKKLETRTSQKLIS